MTNSITWLGRHVSEAVHIQSGMRPCRPSHRGLFITMVIILGSTGRSAMLGYSVENFGRKRLPETGPLGLGRCHGSDRLPFGLGDAIGLGLYASKSEGCLKGMTSEVVSSCDAIFPSTSL